MTSEAQRKANNKYYENTYKAKRKAKTDAVKLEKFTVWIQEFNQLYGTNHKIILDTKGSSVCQA